MRLLLIGMLLLILVIGCKPADKWTTIDFEEVAKGNHAPSASDQFAIMINSVQDLEGLWLNIFKASEVEVSLENVDFSKETVFAVFQGQQSTGGYEVTITNISENNNQVRVDVKATSPLPDAVVTSSFTQPYNIVKTKKITKPASFTWS